MRISPEDVADFDQLSARRIHEWVVSSFTSHVANVSKDVFFPFSTLNLYEHPADGVAEIYSRAKVSTKVAIRSALTALGAACRIDCRDRPPLQGEQRLELLKIFSQLVQHTLSFESATALAGIACDLGQSPNEKLLEDEMFEICLRCLGILAIRNSDSALSTQRARRSVEGALIRVVASQHFRSEFAPYALFGLVSISPHKLLQHVRLMGTYINALHSMNYEQAQLAHHTAKRIVDKALDILIRDWHQLSFRYRRSRDRWLVDALFSRAGPLRLERRGRDIASPTIYVGGEGKRTLPLPHRDWIDFSAEVAYQQEAPKTGSAHAEPIRTSRADIEEFFYSSDIHYIPDSVRSK
jgi:hypothetical protein